MHRLFHVILILHIDDLVQEGSNLLLTHWSFVFLALTPSIYSSVCSFNRRKKCTPRDMHKVGVVMCFVVVFWHCTTVYTFYGTYCISFIRRGALITQYIFSKFLTKDNSYLARLVGIWCVFCSKKIDLCKVWATAVSFQISCYIGPFCNGTLLYLQTERRIMPCLTCKWKN